MNRFISILIAVITIGAVVVFGFLYLSRPATPTVPVQQQGGVPSDNTYVAQSAGRSKEAAKAAFQQAVDRQNIDNTKLYQTSIAGDYALQVWAGNIMGGEALLKYDEVQGRWSIVESSGGSYSEAALVSRGVPTSTAESLLVGMPQ